MAVLQDMAQAERLVAELQAQVAALRLASRRRTTLKLTDKGGVSMYGLGRFPVTLYASQWERLIEAIPDVQAFLRDNADDLSRKE